MSKTTQMYSLVLSTLPESISKGRERLENDGYPFIEVSFRQLLKHRQELTIDLWDHKILNTTYDPDNTDDLADTIINVLHRARLTGETVDLTVFSDYTRRELPEEDPDIRHIRMSFLVIEYSDTEA